MLLLISVSGIKAPSTKCAASTKSTLRRHVPGGLQLVLEELKLELSIGLGWQRRGFLQRQAHLLEHASALALAETHTAQCLDARDTFLGIGHRSGAKGTLQALPEEQQGASGKAGAIGKQIGQAAL